MTHEKCDRIRAADRDALKRSKPKRVAVVTGGLNATLDVVQSYLPANYDADELCGVVFIYGEDNAGWTLDGYVMPRLASGLIATREVTDGEVVWTSITAVKLEG